MSNVLEKLRVSTEEATEESMPGMIRELNRRNEKEVVNSMDHKFDEMKKEPYSVLCPALDIKVANLRATVEDNMFLKCTGNK